MTGKFGESKIINDIVEKLWMYMKDDFKDFYGKNHIRLSVLEGFKAGQEIEKEKQECPTCIRPSTHICLDEHNRIVEQTKQEGFKAGQESKLSNDFIDMIRDTGRGSGGR